MLVLYRTMSVEAGRNTSGRNYKDLYVSRLKQQKAERIALRARLQKRRKMVSAIKCGTFLAPAMDMLMHLLGPIWMLFGTISTLFLVAAKMEGQLPWGEQGWWLVGAPTIFATAVLFLNVVGAVFIECCDPRGMHRGTLADACCCCWSEQCRSVCGDCHTITENSPVGVVVRGRTAGADDDLTDNFLGLQYVSGASASFYAVLLAVPLCSFLGATLVTAKLTGAVDMSYSAALVPWMIASFQVFVATGVAVDDFDDAESVGAIIVGFVVSILQFLNWLLAGLYADGILGDDSACVVGIPFLIFCGFGACSVLVATCAAAAESLREAFERSVPLAICGALCAIPCVFLPAAAIFAPFVLPAFQVCLTFDNGLDPSKAGIAGQDNWYQVFAGWIFYLFLMLPAIGGAVAVVASEGNAFRNDGGTPCISNMCWRGLGSTTRGRELLELQAGLDDEGE